MFKALGTGLLGCAFLVIPVRAGDDAKKDLERLQGTWEVVDIIEDGDKVPAEEVKAMSVACKGEEMFVKLAVKDKKEPETIAAFKLKLDPAKKPATVDFLHIVGEEKGKTSLGVYKIDGNMATFAYRMIGGERPKDFTSQAKSGVTVVVLKRK